MKILHTADWHVGKVLKNQPRIDEQRVVLRDLVRVANYEDVDLVIVAGDLFETAAPNPQAQGLVMQTPDGVAGRGPARRRARRQPRQLPAGAGRVPARARRAGHACHRHPATPGPGRHPQLDHAVGGAGRRCRAAVPVPPARGAGRGSVAAQPFPAQPGLRQPHAVDRRAAVRRVHRRHRQPRHHPRHTARRPVGRRRTGRADPARLRGAARHVPRQHALRRARPPAPLPADRRALPDRVLRARPSRWTSARRPTSRSP